MKDSRVEKHHKKAPTLEHQDRQKKRQQQMSYGALIILAVVVVSFVAWPILSNTASSVEDVRFGSYRGEPIHYSAGYGLFQNNLESLLHQAGGTNTGQRSLFERAFFSTVSQYGRYFFLRDRGSNVSAKEANTLIYKEFINDGKLDRASWNELQNDPNRLKNAQNIMIYAAAQNVWNEIYESMDLINSKELELLVPTLGDFRKVSYLYYRVSDFPETEVEKFYNQNISLFQRQFLRRITVDSKEDMKKVEGELKAGGNFGELAQLYSSDIYSQDKGDYGYQFSYELRDTFRTQGGEAEWADQIFALKRGEYAGPYELDGQWYFFQVKTRKEIEAERAATKKDEAANEGEAETAETTETEVPQDFAVVRNYIEKNEISRITDYFRKNLETLKAQAPESLLKVEQEGLEVRANFSRTPEFFGFSYAGEEGTSLYNPLNSAFTEDGLAAGIARSRQFFEDIFSLDSGELSNVMMFGMERADTSQQYIAFFRLEERRSSNVRDFARSRTENLDSKKSLYNYYLNSLLTGGLALEFLNNRNLKQRFESAYDTWSTRQESVQRRY